MGLCLQLNKLKRSLGFAVFDTSLTRKNVLVILNSDQGLEKTTLSRSGQKSTAR